jgi:hypothetical protein
VLLVGRRHDGVIKSFTSALRERADGHFRDIYYESLLDSGLRCFKLETSNVSTFAENQRLALRPADLDADVFRFWGRALAKLFPRRELDAEFAVLERKVRDELKLDLPAGVISRIASSMWWQIRLYRLLLRRLGARFAIVTDTCEYALSMAARREKVRFVELQHGVFGKQHPDVIPVDAPGSADELLLPENIAVFGEYWREQLMGTALERVRITPVGSSQIERARRLRGARTHTARRRLLVTSQGLDTARFGAWLNDMLVAAPTGTEYDVVVKLHPAYDDPTAPVFAALAARPWVRVIPGTSTPDTYELLAWADLHLSIASTCHFEAIGLQIPTVIIPLSGHESLLGMVDGLAMHLARHPGAVWEIPTKALPAEYATRYGTPGFTDNMRRLLA